MIESCSHADSAKDCSERNAHHPVGNQRMAQTHEYALKGAEGKRDDGRSEDSAEHEFTAHNLIGHCQQKKVADVRSDADRDKTVGGEIDESAHTGQTSDHNLMRKDKCRKAECIKNESKHDKNVILRVGHQTVVFVSVHLRYE